ncbi:hypothetical protein [Gymnodinialimonas hymeniacidonis]|uniref:hypothetical protein n=1 Tax=Gymnodinialimonas hymeniacidonis TaxID=3126508 RepID=UPI0034C68734
MPRFSRFAFLTTAALFSASASFAQEEVTPFDICDMDPATYIADISEGLVGNWEVANLEGLGVMSGGGMVMPVPIPAEGASTADFILSGGDLQVTSWSDPEAPLLDVAVVPSSILFEQVAEAVDGALTQEEVSVVVGCDVTEYPMLQTQFSLSEDGVLLNYRAVFRVLNHTTITGAIYGTVVGEEGSIQVYRPVTMTR